MRLLVGARERRKSAVLSRFSAVLVDISAVLVENNTLLVDIPAAMAGVMRVPVERSAKW